MIIKGWEKSRDNKGIVTYQTIQKKDYNENQPKHLQRGEAYRFFSKNVIRIIEGWKAEDISNRTMTSQNSVWVVDSYQGLARAKFKTKEQALKYAIAYMKLHPNG